MRRRRQLSNRILASVVGILVTTTLVGFALITIGQRATLEREYQRRALAIAETFAAAPAIRAGIAHPDRRARARIQSLAEQVRRAAGASYIVVIDRAGVRFSHPDPRLIGARVSEPVIALDGRAHLGLDHGNLGTSANARVPLRAPDGRIEGEVSAGILERQISGQLVHELPSLLLYFTLALGIGVVASLTLARRLKRSTFGLELDEIAALVQEREATLHGIREGVITLDRRDRVTLVNDEARRLVPLGQTVLGQPIGELVGPGRLRDVLAGTQPGRDSIVVTADHILVVNRMPVAWQGRELGAVITVRDRTELEGLLRELDSVDALIDALRAQQHEFSNRMHTVAGLVELGDQEGAIRYALESSHGSAGLAEAISEHVERAEIAALLVAKTTVASERGVRLTLAPESRLGDVGDGTTTLLTIVGNLIDNAIDAAAEATGEREVTVLLAESSSRVHVEVTDTGPGVPDEVAAEILTDGFTTKSTDGGRQRGIGLALVHRLVHRAGGTLSFETAPEPGGTGLRTTFRVDMPVARTAAVTVPG